MGVITPNSTMYLLNVNIDESQANQLYFTSAAAQATFFQSASVAGLSPASYVYIQKDSVIRVDKNADELYNCNYLMYQNTAFGNKWFYAFVKEIIWRSDQSSDIIFETDVFQTWFFNVTFRPSFIERETTQTDAIGEHLLDEGLDLGDYVSLGQKKAGLGPLGILVSTTISDVTKGTFPWSYDKKVFKGDVYRNIYSGSGMLYFPNTSAGRTSLSEYLAEVTDAGAMEAITGMHMVPDIAVPNTTQVGVGGDGNWAGPATSTYKEVTPSEGIAAGLVATVMLDARPSNFGGLGGFTPKNNKLLSYPYTCVYAHNANGSGATYEIDLWPSANNPSFRVYGDINPPAQFKLVPQSYKGILDNIDEALTIQDFPMVAYSYDAYKAWQAQKGTSTALGVAGSVVAGAASIMAAPATGGSSLAVGALAFTNAAKNVAAYKEASLQPTQSKGNANSGSANSSFKANDFYICYKQIREEWARVLDQFFSIFGYKINRFGTPNFGCRQTWYYIKMANPNIIGPIPSPDMVKLKNIFSNGVTVWNSNAKVGQYTEPNGPIGG